MNNTRTAYSHDNMIEIELVDSESFLKVKETLTRMGIASPCGGKLFQSCHILQKRGRFYIVHFKELYALDGKEDTISQIDLMRRNTIANMIESWGLVKILTDKESLPTFEKEEIGLQLKVISYRDKREWELIPKYVFLSERYRR